MYTTCGRRCVVCRLRCFSLSRNEQVSLDIVTQIDSLLEAHGCLVRGKQSSQGSTTQAGLIYHPAGTVAPVSKLYLNEANIRFAVCKSTTADGIVDPLISPLTSTFLFLPPFPLQPRSLCSSGHAADAFRRRKTRHAALSSTQGLNSRHMSPRRLIMASRPTQLWSTLRRGRRMATSSSSCPRLHL